MDKPELPLYTVLLVFFFDKPFEGQLKVGGKRPLNREAALI